MSTTLVLGLGESGLAMARWLASQPEHEVRVADTRAAPPMLDVLRAQLPQVSFSVGFTEALLDGLTQLAVSPGLSLTEGEAAALITAARTRGIDVVGEIELFARALAALKAESGYSPKLIGVTGTNGKTTTTRLTGLLIESTGKSVAVAGNISPTALDTLHERMATQTLPEVWVLELSSFQLATTQSLVCDAATVLNVTQDHLDWHGTFDSYAQAKARIFAAGTTRVLNRDDATVMGMVAPSRKIVEGKAAKAAARLAAKPSPHPNPLPEGEGTQHQPLLAGEGAHQPVATGEGVPTEGVHPPPPPGEGRGVRETPAPKTTPVTFGSDAPAQPDAYGLVFDGGVTWLAYAEDLSGGAQKKRKGAAEPVHEIHVHRLMPADALRIRGRHNTLNALAALALARAIGCPLAPMLHALREYTGEPHRVEWIATIDGVEYYDDSKGTNVGATVAALDGLGAPERKLGVILGGDGKGQDFAPLVAPLARHARVVALIGRDADAIAALLADAPYAVQRCADLAGAVQVCARSVQSGDAVLLSPACASLDMFRNYAHRAEVFVEAVRELAAERGQPC